MILRAALARSTESSQLLYPLKPPEYGLESVCPSIETWLESFPTSCARATSNSFPLGLGTALPSSKNVPRSRFRQFDPKSFRGNRHVDVLLQLLEVRQRLDLLFVERP